MDDQIEQLRRDLRTIHETLRYAGRNVARNAKERDALQRICDFAKVSMPAREYPAVMCSKPAQPTEYYAAGWCRYCKKRVTFTSPPTEQRQYSCKSCGKPDKLMTDIKPTT